MLFILVIDAISENDQRGQNGVRLMTLGQSRGFSRKVAHGFRVLEDVKQLPFIGDLMPFLLVTR
jgi:hypothetical protein